MALNQKAGSPLATEPHVSGIQHHDIVEICSGVRERLTPYLRNGNARSLSSSIPELVQNFCSGLQVELEAARDDFAEKQRDISRVLQLMVDASDDKFPMEPEITKPTKIVGDVRQSRAYKLLIGDLIHVLSLQQPVLGAGHLHIRQSIADSFPSKSLAHAQTVCIRLPWPLGKDNVRLKDVLAFTMSSPDQGQLTTVEEYLIQAWSSLGTSTLELIQRQLDGRQGDLTTTTNFASGTLTVLNVSEAGIEIRASGPGDFVIKVAEQLAWLAAAFHSNHNRHHEDQQAQWNPCVELVQESSTLAWKVHISYQHCRVSPSARHLLGRMRLQLNSLAVRCTNVVSGFPIAYRRGGIPGLEVSLSVRQKLSSMKADFGRVFNQKNQEKHHPFGLHFGSSTWKLVEWIPSAILNWHEDTTVHCQCRHGADSLFFLTRKGGSFYNPEFLRPRELEGYRWILGLCPGVDESQFSIGNLAAHESPGTAYSARLTESPASSSPTILDSSLRSDDSDLPSMSQLCLAGSERTEGATDSPLIRTVSRQLVRDYIDSQRHEQLRDAPFLTADATSPTFSFPLTEGTQQRDYSELERPAIPDHSQDPTSDDTWRPIGSVFTPAQGYYQQQADISQPPQTRNDFEYSWIPVATPLANTTSPGLPTGNSQQPESGSQLPRIGYSDQYWASDALDFMGGVPSAPTEVSQQPEFNNHQHSWWRDVPDSPLEARSNGRSLYSPSSSTRLSITPTVSPEPFIWYYEPSNMVIHCSGPSAEDYQQRLGGAKRDREQETDDHDPEDKAPRKRQIRSSPHVPADRAAERPQLACPFWKFNPRKHKSCFLKKLDDVSRVKQHLTRTHYRSSYCPRCFAVLEDDVAVSVHLDPVTCVPKQHDFSLMTNGQHQRINRRSNTKQSEQEKWYAVWDILFPEQSRPSSPYIDPRLSEDLSRFIDHAKLHGPAMIAAQVRSERTAWPAGSGESEKESVPTLEQVISQGLSTLIDSWFTDDPVQQHPAARQQLGTQPPGFSVPQIMTSGSEPLEASSSQQRAKTPPAEHDVNKDLDPAREGSDDQREVSVAVLQEKPQDVLKTLETVQDQQQPHRGDGIPSDTMGEVVERLGLEWPNVEDSSFVCFETFEWPTPHFDWPSDWLEQEEGEA